MATSFAQPILQVFDDYGVILAGGKIYTYEAGTTTPLVTYQDLEGAVPNTNPVILDAAGRATVRLTNGVAYKFVITDEDDAVVVTLDDIVVGYVPSDASITIIIPMTFLGTPAAQGFMGSYNAIEPFTFPIDFEGALGSAQTAPAAEFVISIRKNGAEIGTATIDTAGQFSFATTSHTAKPIVNGDTITFWGPDTAGTVADIGLSLTGEIE